MTTGQLTLQDILHWTRECHRRLSSCLHSYSDICLDVRLKQLLGYLATHEANISSAIDHLERMGEPGALASWCYDHRQCRNMQPVAACNSYEGMTSWEVMGSVMERHKQVIERCRYFRSQTRATGSQHLLEALCILEEQEAVQLAQGARGLEDY